MELYVLTNDKNLVITWLMAAASRIPGAVVGD